ncbi:MAG TPA: SpoIIE family protein phosphatase [Kofleriaceae bacterium]|nr:SpoIIE family protein phosphatase [Kofleriaceae bacterium]
MRRRLSLGTKLTLGTALLIATAVASSAWYGLNSLDSYARASGEARRNDLEKAFQREAELLTRNASATSASLLATSDYTRLEEIARNLAVENRNVVWIALVEPSGTVAAASDKAPAKQGGKIDDPLAKTLETAASGKVEQIPDPADKSHLLLGTPVFIPDSTGKEVRVGTVRLAFDMSAMERAQQEALAAGRERARASAERQLLFAGLLLAIGLLLALWQALRISRPLLALSEQARHIAAGDFGRRVVVKTGDEVGQLGESFNRMSESLVYLVEEIGRKASLERELEVARSIQGLMTPPPEAVALDSFNLIGRCEMASACGGDWWSYRQLADGRLLLVVGDVTGHGMPSAMIAATGRGAVESLAFINSNAITPELVLRAIDKAIRDVGERLLMTCFAMILRQDGVVDYANAGHTFPYVISDTKKQPMLEILPTRSNPLGSYRPHIAEGKCQLANGDFIVLTSDGLTDRVSREGTRFGDKRLRKALMEEVTRGTNNVRALCDRVVGEVNRFGGEQPVDDDITLVIVQYSGTATGSRKGINAGRGAAA